MRVPLTTFFLSLELSIVLGEAQSLIHDFGALIPTVNITKHQLSRPSSIPWHFIFAQGIWQLWLARNKKIFSPPSDSLNHLLHKTLNLALEFFFVISLGKTKTSTCVKYIAWQPPLFPFSLLNTDGSSLSNAGIAGGGCCP